MHAKLSEMTEQQRCCGSMVPLVQLTPEQVQCRVCGARFFVEVNDPGILGREAKRELWGEGPWVDEPDRYEFRHKGLPCLVTRHPVMGHLCGYVAVPPGHPWHGKSNPPVYCHGGATYADSCLGRVCHVPEPGEPEDVWWFGFDCGHGFDLCPLMANNPIGKLLGSSGNAYRDFVYVKMTVRALAEQLHELNL